MTTATAPQISTSADGLTALLDTLSLRGVALYRGRFSAPWSVSFDRDTGDGTTPRETNVPANATFHMILGGAPCVVRLDDGAAVTVCPGDFVLLPHADSRVLASDARTPATPLDCALRRGTITPDGWFCYGGNGATTETLCGDFYFAGEVRGTPKPLTHPLLATLPPVIVLRGENNSPQPWLASMLDAMRCETTSDRPGRQTIVNRLSEILFIQAVREYLVSGDAACPDAQYLRALSEGKIAPALLAMHTRPAESWSVESLAATCYLSRSVFAQVFTERVGASPLAYLTRWRLFLAGRYLRGRERLTLAEIAAKVGYGSEAAFSKVFKTHTGIAPGEYRGSSTGGSKTPEPLPDDRRHDIGILTNRDVPLQIAGAVAARRDIAVMQRDDGGRQYLTPNTQHPTARASPLPVQRPVRY